MSKSEIYIIRHGATPDEKTAMGGWSEEGLGAEGRKQAEKAAGEVPKDVQGIITSDLERAVETAKIISEKTGIPIIAKDSALRSWNLGKYSGKNPEKVEPILEELANKEPSLNVPGGGESFNEYRNRFLEGVEKLKKRYKDKKIAIVTHSHGTRILRAWQAKDCPEDYSIDMASYNRKAMGNGGVKETNL